MFLMIGVTQRRQDFPYAQPIQCAVCGKFGRYQVFMTYSVLLLFFIPCSPGDEYSGRPVAAHAYQLDSAGGPPSPMGGSPYRQTDLTITERGRNTAPPADPRFPKTPATVRIAGQNCKSG
jgi:hypothetical protein